MASTDYSYESRQGALVGLQLFLLCVALTMTALRMYSRIIVVRSHGPDDYIMVLATLLSVGLTINAVLGSTYGWGLHVVDLLPENYGNALLVGWIGQVLFPLTTSSMKISILTFYLRFATTITYRRVIYGSIIWLAIWGITFFVVAIFQCNPVNGYWDLSLNANCFSLNAALLVNGITNIVNDLFVYILPMPMLWKIQLPKRQRIGLLALFGVGSLYVVISLACVCIAAALRTYYSFVVNNSYDGTWPGFDLWTWEAVEIDLGIACACAPALKPLFLRWFPNIMNSVFGRSSGTSRKALADENANFVLMDSPTAAFRGAKGETKNTSDTYGMSESQERIYNPSNLPLPSIGQTTAPQGNQGRDNRGRRNADVVVTRIEIIGAQSGSNRLN